MRSYLLILICISAGVPLSTGATLDVTRFGAVPDDDQDDAPAIERAIASSRQGDTIRFPTGRFIISRQLSPPPGRTFCGNTQLRWTRDGDLAGDQAPTILQGPPTQHLFRVAADQLGFSHLTFSGRAIFCDRPGGGMISGLSIDNCHFILNVEGEHPTAVQFTTGLKDGRITNSLFRPINGDTAIYGYYWDGLMIANNWFVDGSEGIHIADHGTDSRGLLIEQNYFAGLRRMGIEYQGGGIDSIIQDNYYEKPSMTSVFNENMSTFAYSIICDRSRNTITRRNFSYAPQRPDGTGVRIIFEIGGEDAIVEDNYSDGGNHVVAFNGGKGGVVRNNCFRNYLKGPSAAPWTSGTKFINNGPEVKLSWDIHRGRPGPNRRYQNGPRGPATEDGK